MTGGERFVPEVGLQHLFVLRLKQRQINDLGMTPLGHRRVVDLDGGSFDGERLSGIVRVSGGDEALIRLDEVFVPDCNLVLETQDGALIRMEYTGRWTADPGHMSRLLNREGDLNGGGSRLRVFGLFETGDPRYEFLNRCVALGTGVATSVGIEYHFFEVL